MKNKFAKRILAFGLTALIGCQALALTGCGSTKDQLGTSAETESSVSDTEGNTSGSANTSDTSNTSDSTTKSTKSAKSSDTDVSLSLIHISEPTRL